MVSEACQQYMQHVDAAAAHSGPAQDVLSILEAAQQAAEVRLPTSSVISTGYFRQRLFSHELSTLLVGDLRVLQNCMPLQKAQSHWLPEELEHSFHYVLVYTGPKGKQRWAPGRFAHKNSAEAACGAHRSGAQSDGRAA